MEGSIEEEELTAQRDAVVSLCKGLQEKVRRVSNTSKSHTLHSSSTAQVT